MVHFSITIYANLAISFFVINLIKACTDPLDAYPVDFLEYQNRPP